jgi:pyrophosphate--fructose-6-phosphate 1-phosphotransferase
MGRSASHIALECALQTHPNITLIGEEVAAQRKTLAQITHEICDTICARAAQGKNHGVILIPEGIIEFIPEFKQLIGELNLLLAADKPHQAKLAPLSSQEQFEYIVHHLSQNSQHCYQALPKELQTQLVLDRDPHGNVQVSKIETERLFIEVVRQELKERKMLGSYTGSFNAQPLFCGYEGRSAFPSNFDAQYCYALGHIAALLVDAKLTGYICSIQNLSQAIEDWEIGARNIITMMTTEKRNGKDKPVIKKALVELNGRPFHVFQELRQQWLLNDDYCYPGPIQFFGPPELTNAVTHTLQLEHERG